MQTGINIGTVVDKQSLDPMTDAIVRIMESRADQETIRRGLETLSQMAKIDEVTIQHCTVMGDRHITIESDNEVVTEYPAGVASASGSA